MSTIRASDDLGIPKLFRSSSVLAPAPSVESKSRTGAGPQSVARIIASEKLMIKRRVEIISFQRERILRRPLWTLCPVCHSKTELLTTCQAGALAQVNAGSIRRWLAQGRAHGVKTSGGHHRICRQSLFRLTSSAMWSTDETGLDRKPTHERGQLIAGENGIP